jgi:hypothetical protein
VSRATIRRNAEDTLRQLVQPGEQIVAGAAVTSDPSHWGIAGLGAAALALMVVGLAGLLGSQPSPLLGGLVVGLALPLIGLGSQFLARPMYVAVTDRRLICCRLSRLRSAPGRLAFAAPLADIRIANCRSGRFSSSVRCEIAGQKGIRLDAGRAWRQDFADVDMVLARSGAYTASDPPYPSVANC